MAGPVPAIHRASVRECDGVLSTRGRALDGWPPRRAAMTDMGNERFHHAIRMGDDALILGQRLSEWCGHAPMLEVDLSLANIGLDLIGQATHFLGVAAEAEGN